MNVFDVFSFQAEKNLNNEGNCRKVFLMFLSKKPTEEEKNSNFVLINNNLTFAMEYEYGFSVKNSVNDNPDMFIAHRDTSNYHFEQVEACLSAQVNVGESPLGNLYEWREIREQEPDCYWYHPDHLGSSSWITYTDGSAVQHLHYLPWGEDFVDQRTTNWAARHTFSAKEKDTETGLSYFGSRYYSSDLSVWLSVDPLSDKYPSLSPYTYCADNPILVKDSKGDSVAVVFAKSLPVVGHLAMLIQVHGGENDGKWALWSKNGENKTWS